MFFGADGLEFVAPAQGQSARLGLRFPGANAQAELRGESPQTGRVNYLRGSRAADWIVGVPTFADIRYRSLYAGIDLVFHQADESSGGTLEHDFIVAPGAYPARIALAVDVAAKLTLQPSGDLDVRFGTAHMVLKKPVAWQGPESKRQPVAVSFRLLDQHTIAFSAGPYDRSRELTIDPVLHFSTYLDGTGTETASAVKTDAAGNVYVVGSTTSIDFPLKAAEQSTCASSFAQPCSSAFVTKLDPLGHSLIFSTYLGGTAQAAAKDVAIAPDGSVIVAGVTQSAGFPEVGKLANTYPISNATYNFLLSLSSDGSSLQYSGLLGGISAAVADPNPRRATNVAVDAQGAAYLTGTTNDNTFPKTPGAYGNPVPGNPGVDTLFIAKVATDGALVYAATIPGNAPVNFGNTNNSFRNGGIQVDARGEAVVGGAAGLGLPTTPGSLAPTNPNSTVNTQFAAAGFALKLNASGSDLLFATYLPGTDTGDAIALNANGDVYVAGSTNEAGLPVSANAYGGGSAAGGGCNCSGYVIKLSADGSRALAATYVPGVSTPNAMSFSPLNMSLDGIGNVVLGGGVQGGPFPVTNPLFATQPNGSIVAELSPDLSTLLFSSYLGTDASPAQLNGLSVDAQNRIVIAGNSGSSPFPTTAGSFQSMPPQGTPDSPALGPYLFVASIDLAVPAPSLCFSTETVRFGAVLVNASQENTVTVTNCGNAPLSLDSVSSSDSKVTVQHSCSGVAPGGQCQISLTYTPVAIFDLTTGTVTLNGNMGASPQRIGFIGTSGLPDVYVPGSLGFGDQLVGRTSTNFLTFTNVGAVPFAVTSATATGDFQIVKNQCSTPVPPPAMNPGGDSTPSSCEIDVAFKPTAAGTRMGTLTLVDDLPPGMQTVALAGNGLTSATVPSITVIPATLAMPTGATLTVIGHNFFPTSVVSWNGSARPTTYLNERALTAQLSAADVAQLGEAPVTVSTPAPGGGVTPSTLALLYGRINNLPITHAVFEPHAQLLYATVSAYNQPGSDVIYSNSLVVYDPVSQKVVKTLLTGNTPDAIAVSDDGTMLYVGLDATSSIVQIGLPDGTVNFTIQLGSNSEGPLVANAIAVVPGAAHTFAISSSNRGCSLCGAAVQIYDDAVPRPGTASNVGYSDDVLQFVSDPTVFYSTQLTEYPAVISSYKIDPSGVSLAKASTPDNGLSGAAMDTDGKSLYLSTGKVVDPSTLTLQSSFDLFGTAFQVDAPNSRVYFANNNPPFYELPNNTLTLAVADLKTHQTLSQIGFPEQFIPQGTQRFSNNGILMYGENDVLVMRTGLTGVSATLPPPAALPVASLNPTGLTFDTQPLNTSSAAQTVTLTSAGTSSLAVATIQASTGFSETDNCSGQTLPPATACQIQVTFTPTAAGPIAGTLTVTDNAAEAPQTITLSGAGEAPPLAIAPQAGGSTIATVAAGQPAIYNLAMAAGPGFSGPVSLACSGAPANASCTVNPASLTLAAGASASFTVTVRTAAQMAAQSEPPSNARYAGASLLSLAAMFSLFCLRRRVWGLGLTLCLLIACTLTLAGCGGGVPNTSTPPPATSAMTAAGTYTLTVTASAAAASSTQKLTLVVQ